MPILHDDCTSRHFDTEGLRVNLINLDGTSCALDVVLSDLRENVAAKEIQLISNVRYLCYRCIIVYLSFILAQSIMTVSSSTDFMPWDIA